jgi:hypothetical protein
MKCPDLFVRCRQAEGVAHVFTLEDSEVWNKELEEIICPLD